MPALIIWLRGTQIGREFELGDGELTIGRSSENTIPVGSGRASRRHAAIRADPGGYLLVDLESANGTIVNGHPIDEPYRLIPGDLFEVGDELFRFDISEPAFVTTAIQQVPTPAQPTAPPGPSPPAPPPAPIPGPEPLAARPGARRWLLITAVIIIVVLLAALAVYTGLSRAGPGLPASVVPPQALAQAPALPAGNPGAPAAWTVLVYLDGDNDLEADALRDLNEMERVGSSEQLRIIVQLDRAGRAGEGQRWSSARRYLVQRDSDEQQIGSPILADLGEPNMGDPQTLADFVVWGARQYPAQRYALVIWDHGSAWAGIAFDTSSDGDGLSLPELAAALQTAQAQLDGMRLDLIGFDACLMSQLDVLLTIAPYGRAAVASAELEPSDGWDWRAWLGSLERDPSMDGPALARMAVETYRDYYQARDVRTATLAAFDLAALPDVAARTDEFALALEREIDATYRPMAEARSYVTIYSQPRTEEFSAVDLGDLARLAIERGLPEPAAQRASALATAIDTARIAGWSGTFHARGTGLSVFFPQASERFPSVYEEISPLARGTAWARFVRAFLNTGDIQASTPRIANLRAAADPADGVLLQGSVAGQGIAGVFFFVGVPNADRSGVQLVDIAYVQPPAGSPTAADAPIWSVGPHILNERWSATQWSLNNGEASIPVLLGPARYGTDLYGVEGLYQAQDDTPPIDAALLFRRTNGQTALLSVYGFPRGREQAAQPFEIRPAPGDRFTAQIRTYTVDGERLVPGRVTGETITFGTTPLRAIAIPAATGDYVAGFLVRDIAGRFSYAYRDIRITGS